MAPIFLTRVKSAATARTAARSPFMILYHLQTCDRAGLVLEDRCIEAWNVFGALAIANGCVREEMIGAEPIRIDPQGRIDVHDGAGNTVARLICAEAIAAAS